MTVRVLSGAATRRRGPEAASLRRHRLFRDGGRVLGRDIQADGARPPQPRDEHAQLLEVLARLRELRNF